MLSNTCERPLNPETGRRCWGQMEFFGISAKKIRLPRWPRAITVHFRWQQCTSCGQYRQETFSGQVVTTIDKMTDKQIEALFPTEERKNDRFGKVRSKGSKSSKTRTGLQGSISAHAA